MLTRTRLLEVLTYDADTGLFRWKWLAPKARGVFVGDIAGTFTTFGHVQIKINRVAYMAHRLAWLYVHGEWPWVIDHIDSQPANNRIANLRNVTHSINSENRKRADRDNPTGLLGAHRLRPGKFSTCIQVRGVNHYLGVFPTAELAHAAYIEAKRRLHVGNTL